jgi:hypothetical protein
LDSDDINGLLVTLLGRTLLALHRKHIILSNQ